MNSKRKGAATALTLRIPLSQNRGEESRECGKSKKDAYPPWFQKRTNYGGREESNGRVLQRLHADENPKR